MSNSTPAAASQTCSLRFGPHTCDLPAGHRDWHHCPTCPTTEMESTMTTDAVDALRMIEHFHRPRELGDGKLVCSRCHDIDGNPIDFPCADYCVVAPEGSSIADAVDG